MDMKVSSLPQIGMFEVNEELLLQPQIEGLKSVIKDHVDKIQIYDVEKYLDHHNKTPFEALLSYVTTRIAVVLHLWSKRTLTEVDFNEVIPGSRSTFRQYLEARILQITNDLSKDLEISTDNKAEVNFEIISLVITFTEEYVYSTYIQSEIQWDDFLDQITSSQEDEPIALDLTQEFRQLDELEILATPDENGVNAVQDIEEDNLSNVIPLTFKEAWLLIDNLIGWESDYIQNEMIPRWKNKPDLLEQDRRFLYITILDTIKSSLGITVIAGNMLFQASDITVDGLWGRYYASLSNKVSPILSEAKLDQHINLVWYKRLWRGFLAKVQTVNHLWITALVVAYALDWYTTQVTLEQSPMSGIEVFVFTILMTAIFQLADRWVIDYRKREFEADGLIAKFQASVKRYDGILENLETTSESFIKISMDRAQASSDLKAAEDSRKMARRGVFWTARIADLNVIVTAYGLAFVFLDAREPMYAIYQQVMYVSSSQLEMINLWVPLMLGLAITVSFVVNTAQRTEILGWSMKKLKQK